MVSMCRLFPALFFLCAREPCPWMLLKPARLRASPGRPSTRAPLRQWAVTVWKELPRHAATSQGSDSSRRLLPCGDVQRGTRPRDGPSTSVWFPSAPNIPIHALRQTPLYKGHSRCPGAAVGTAPRPWRVGESAAKGAHGTRETSPREDPALGLEARHLGPAWLSVALGDRKLTGPKVGTQSHI